MAAGSDASAAKAKRYDRQLRIWGAHGQDALEQAHICLLNASESGETLPHACIACTACNVCMLGTTPGVRSAPELSWDITLCLQAHPMSQSTCAGPTGTETLKNLVLGGIAAFTVVDGGAVVPADLGNNFLVEASALGQPRAPAVTASLKACVAVCSCELLGQHRLLLLPQLPLSCIGGACKARFSTIILNIRRCRS